MHPILIGRKYAVISASVIFAIGGILAITVASLLIQRNSVLKITNNTLLGDVTAAAQMFDSTLKIADFSLENVKGEFLPARPVEEERRSVSSAAFRMQGIHNVYLLDDEGQVLTSAFPRLDPSLRIGQGILDQLRNGADASCNILEAPAEGGRALVLIKVLRREYPPRYGAVVFSSSEIQERFTANLPRTVPVMSIRDSSGEWLSPESVVNPELPSWSQPMQASITLSRWLITVSFRTDRETSLRGWRSLSFVIIGIVTAFIVLLVLLLVFGAKLARNADKADELTKVAEHQRADIAEAKRVEQILKASEERYRFALEATGQIGWATPPDGLVEDLPLWRQYSGQSVDEVRGWRWLDAVHPDDRESASAAWNGAIEKKCNYQTEYRIRRADGLYRHFMVRGIPLLNADGSCREWTGTCIDITDRKQAEEFLRSSLDEKTTLLKEVHHRVKNNLQIVASLINLQASRFEDSRMVDAFRNVEGRIVSMALLHEALYRSDSLSRIDFSAYVEKLCGQLLRSFDSLSNKVTLECRIASIGLSLERSVPCGLIINELVSNALKHAFPGGRAGKIVVEMSLADGDLVVLGVRDDGVGLPAGFDAATSPTLGLRLVQKLAQQLGGRCETENTGNEGTSIRLSFPIDTEEMVGSQG